MNNILITGGAGFIGSHVTRLFVKAGYNVYNYDKLTYAGNLLNIKDLEYWKNYHFIKGDITDAKLVESVFFTYNIDTVIHLAAESHVDRSIDNPNEFVNTNVIGTVTLLNAARNAWEGDYEGKLFYHVSTDEVYGSLEPEDPKFDESTRYEPHSPYSASKASSDHFVRAYHDTYGLPTVISNCSNNYGPNQFPEKFIPLVINNILNYKEIPVYGKGDNVRDWLYVKDHAKAIFTIASNHKVGETYNIGGNQEMTNIQILDTIIKSVASHMTNSSDARYVFIDDAKHLIKHVTDRKGHDKRYAINTKKYEDTFNVSLPYTPFEEGIKETVEWYLNNKEWLDSTTSGEYQKYYEEHYGNR